MRKTIISLGALAVLALVDTAAWAVPVKLVAYNQRSGATLSTLKWDGCTTYTASTPCINPGNPNLAAAGITPSTAVWDWNPVTGVLSMTGTFNAASTIGSSGSAVASMVIGDRVSNLTVNTVSQTTTASNYACAEGNFLGSVGANGCLNLNLGDDGILNSSAAYDVGGDANCVQRTISGDDVSTGPVRTLADTAGGGGCDAGDGAFNLWTVVQDDLGTGGQLIISNGIAITLANTAYLTFEKAPPKANDDSGAGFSVPSELPTSLDVLANDTSLDSSVTVTIGSGADAPQKGTATVTGANPGAPAGIKVQYTSNSGATGTDSFKYTVAGSSGSSTATVTVAILEVGANPDTATTTRNKAVTINVGANDIGFTDPVTVTITTAPDHGGSAVPGAAGPAADASVTFTPSSTAGTPGYTETFVYRITGADSVNKTATVTVTVNNTIPVAGTGAVTISTVNAAPASTSGTFNAGTAAGNSLGNTPSTVTATAGGKGTTSVSGSVVTYTPSATFYSGSDTFSYTITDSDPGTPEAATGTVTVTIAPASPTLTVAAITTPVDTAATQSLVVGAGNGPLAGHTFAVTTAAGHGTCALIDSNTKVQYTPAAGYSGADSCGITVTDLDGSATPATVAITVKKAGGGGGGGNILPGGGGSLDAWLLALLATGAWIRRRHQAQ